MTSLVEMHLGALGYRMHSWNDEANRMWRLKIENHEVSIVADLPVSQMTGFSATHGRVRKLNHLLMMIALRIESKRASS